MKKLFYFLAILLLLSGCSSKTDSIPSLVQVQQNGGEWAAEALLGYTADELEAVWGEAPWMLSGFDGYIWRVPGDWDEVTVYFAGEKREVTHVGYTHVVKAEILEISQDYVTVRPFDGEWERNSADQIVVNLDEWQEEIPENFAVGDIVLVHHSGTILETYPAQFEGMCQLVPINRADTWSFQK